MIANVGDVVKYYIDFNEGGVHIQQGKVCKIKEGFFTRKYLIEVKGLLDFNTTKAHWIKEGNILEITG